MTATDFTAANRADLAERLLPCPFCGSPAEYALKTPGGQAVCCTSNDCDAHLYFVGPITWNRRAALRTGDGVDAERYRHMRSHAQFQWRNGPGLYWYLPRLYWYLPRNGVGSDADRFDAAIDDAISASREGKQS